MLYNSQSDAEKHALHLRKQLLQANAAYFNAEPTLFSEDVRDQLKQDLLAIEKQYPELISSESPTQNIGALPASNTLNKVRHKTKRYSLGDGFSDKDIRDFDARVRRFLHVDEQTVIPYSVEWKIDGINITLWYEKGQLVTAVTRGNGSVGENISHAVQTIMGIPHEIPGGIDAEITGECYISKEHFAAMQSQEAEDTYANPRNLTAGTVRLLDTAVIKQRQLQMLCYALGEHTADEIPQNQSELFALFETWGFPYNPCQVFNDISSVIAYIHSVEETRKDFPYDTDGLVIKVHDMQLRERLGYTAKIARYAIAYKFPPEEQYTQLNAITWQVGRTGTITPVAELTPVTIDGSVVSRATLHNADELTRKAVMLGDQVIVRKAGDIIPEIVGVVMGLRDDTVQPITLPKFCPACSESLDTSETQWRCVNIQCPAQIEERMVYFASILDIRGLGRETVKQLLAHGLLTDISDLWRLTAEDLSQLDGFKAKKIQNLLTHVGSRKTCSPELFLTALGIPLIGKQTAEALIAIFREQTGTCDLNDFLIKAQEISEHIWTEYDGIGDTVTQQFLAWLRSPQTDILLTKCFEVGLRFAWSDILTVADTEGVTGRTFVITGSFELISRKELKELLIRHGGRISSSVSTKTDVLIAGEKPGSKRSKAEELSVEIWSEKDIAQYIAFQKKEASLF